MRKLTIAAFAAALLATGASPAAASDVSIPPPPTDVLIIEGGGGCGGEACTPRPYSVEVDETYPRRLLYWVADLLP
jgi:hypothetical protein